MEELKSLVISIFGLCISLAVTISVMIYGWGLSPKSWWWIIGMYLIGHLIALMMADLAKKK